MTTTLIYLYDFKHKRQEKECGICVNKKDYTTMKTEYSKYQVSIYFLYTPLKILDTISIIFYMTYSKEREER